MPAKDHISVQAPTFAQPPCHSERGEESPTLARRGEISSARSRRGFTLLELLVVISIILVLAGLILPAVHLVQVRAKQTTAQTEVENIAAAWRHYYSEYQRWPSSVAGETPMEIADDLAALLHAGVVGPDNPRRMSFMKFRTFNADDNPISPWGIMDATDADTEPQWYYYVLFDANYDRTIPALAPGGPPAWNAPTTNEVQTDVIVWTVNDNANPGDEGYIIGSWK